MRNTHTVTVSDQMTQFKSSITVILNTTRGNTGFPKPGPGETHRSVFNSCLIHTIELSSSLHILNVIKVIIGVLEQRIHSNVQEKGPTGPDFGACGIILGLKKKNKKKKLSNLT